MATQRIYRNGNSLVFTVPLDYLKRFNLKEGSELIVEKKDDALLLTPKKKTLAHGVDVKFMKMLDSFISDHEDVLQKLAQK